MIVSLYVAAAPLRPVGPEGPDSPLLPEHEWLKLDPVHRPMQFMNAAGETRVVPLRGVGPNALAIFTLVQKETAKEVALYFRKRSRLPPVKAEAVMLTALAGDFDEYCRVAEYSPDELEQWWRQTVLTAEGQMALTAFRREYDKRGLFR